MKVNERNGNDITEKYNQEKSDYTGRSLRGER